MDDKIEADDLDVKKRKIIEENGDDIIIKICVDDSQVFKIQKSSLTKNSPVFKSMFEHDTEENQTNIVKIKGYSSEIVQLFLKYLENGRIDKNLNENDLNNVVIKEMFQLADYYQVENLKKLCLSFICSTLTITNIFSIFEFSTKFQSNELKDRVVSFIKSNLIEVSKSEEWQKFDLQFKCDIQNEFIQQFASGKSDELLNEEISLSISNMSKRKSDIKYFYDTDRYHHKQTFILKNTGKSRVVFNIVWNERLLYLFYSRPWNGFLEPGEERKITIKYDNEVNAFIIYEASEETQLSNCFKQNSFVRQISIDLKSRHYWNIFQQMPDDSTDEDEGGEEN